MKIKNLLFVAAILSGSLALSQSADRTPQAASQADLNKIKQKNTVTDLNTAKSTACIDTVRYPQIKEQLVGTANFWNTTLSADDNEAISQKYDLGGTSLQISEIEFLGGNSPLSATNSITVEVAVYNVDASNNPTTLLGSGSMAITDTNFLYRQISLTTPVTVTNDYAVVIRPTSANHLLRFYMSDIPTGQVQDENLSRATSSTSGGWVDIPTYTAGWGGGPYDFEALISPIVSYTLDASFSTSPAQLCENQPVNFTNTSAAQDILGSRMYSYQYFRFNFGLATADTTYAYVMQGAANVYWEENPTHTFTGSGNFNTTIYNFGGLWSGCTDTTLQVVTVDPLDDATVTYPQTEYCTTNANTTPSVNSTGTFAASPAGLVFANANTGEINIGGSTPGVYTVTFTTTGPCPNSGTTQITINEPSTAGFQYAQAQYCADATSNPVANMDAGATAGTFTATPAGLSLNGFTGEITLSSSTPGTYTVTNTVAGAGGCPQVTASTTVEVTAVDDATFSYSSNTLCLGGSNATPTTNASGSFSVSPAGLVFADANTGEINLAASSANTYTVTFNTSGACPNSSSETITLTSSPDATFTYNPASFCLSEGPQTPIFPAGASAGSFSASPTGLTIAPSTGNITLSTSVPGTYTITNTIAASGSCPQAQETFTVEVYPLPVVSAGTDQTLCENHDPMSLAGTPTGGTYSGPGVTGTEFDPAAAGLGVHTITYNYTDPNGCEGSATVELTVEDCASIDKNEAFEGISIMPNPATDYIDIVTEGYNKVHTIQVISAQGRIVKANMSSPNANTTRIDVSNTAKGTYFIQIETSKGQVTKKVIVQ